VRHGENIIITRMLQLAVCQQSLCQSAGCRLLMSACDETCTLLQLRWQKMQIWNCRDYVFSTCYKGDCGSVSLMRASSYHIQRKCEYLRSASCVAIPGRVHLGASAIVGRSATLGCGARPAALFLRHDVTVRHVVAVERRVGRERAR
jgi:hypothetical protein